MRLLQVESTFQKEVSLLPLFQEFQEKIDLVYLQA